MEVHYISVKEESSIHINRFSFAALVNFMHRSLAVFVNQNISILYGIDGSANIKKLKMLSNVGFLFVS